METDKARNIKMNLMNIDTESNNSYQNQSMQSVNSSGIYHKKKPSKKMDKNIY